MSRYKLKRKATAIILFSTTLSTIGSFLSAYFLKEASSDELSDFCHNNKTKFLCKSFSNPEFKHTSLPQTAQLFYTTSGYLTAAINPIATLFFGLTLIGILGITRECIRPKPLCIDRSLYEMVHYPILVTGFFLAISAVMGFFTALVEPV